MSKQIAALVESDPVIAGLMSGAPEELTGQFKSRLRSMLSARSADAIKEQIPALVGLAVRITLESAWCPRCDVPKPAGS